MALKEKIKNKFNKIKKYLGFKVLLPHIYKKYCKKPIDEKLVVFADIRDRAMPDNFIGLWELCKKNGYTCVEHSGRIFGNECPRNKRYKTKFKYKCDFMKLYARAKVVFMVEAFDPAYVVGPRPGTQLVQLWHACGLMKTMGYASPVGSWGMSEKDRQTYMLHLNYTLVCASSERVRYGYHRAFACDFKNIKAIGSPRTDIYFNKEFKDNARKELLKLFPEIGDRKIILYAPTFRGKSIPSSYMKRMIDYEVFNEALSDKYALVAKFHPQLVKGKLSEKDRLANQGFLFDATGIVSPEIALCAADMLITDYSSIMFEYMLLERPIISYIYDIDEYAGGRGFFDKYDNLAPGPYISTQDKLLEAVLTVDDWFDIDRVRKYKELFMSACDGHSTERIYNYVFDPEFRKEYDKKTLPYKPSKYE